MTLGATHGRDFGCYHSLSAVPWDTPRAFRSASWWLLCWLGKQRGDVCLCKDTVEMLARMRLAQLRREHKEDRDVPDGLRSMCRDTAALAEILH